MDFIKIWNLCSTKDTIKRRKKIKLQTGEKMCKTIPDKEVVSRIYKEFSKHSNNYCAPRDTIHREKRQSTKWQKIITSHISAKGLIFRTYKELLQQLKTTQLKNVQKTWTDSNFIFILPQSKKTTKPPQ